MGHLGLTRRRSPDRWIPSPGAQPSAACTILEVALLLQEAGCFSLVLESIPGRLATLISERLEIPTIGIGAGAGCDGQVLVTHDLLGLFDRFTPGSSKKYASLHALMVESFTSYIEDVRTIPFHSPSML
jgi:3-methyl-2-oxobutanoate hydroxymethyltransferase